MGNSRGAIRLSFAIPRSLPRDCPNTLTVLYSSNETHSSQHLPLCSHIGSGGSPTAVYAVQPGKLLLHHVCSTLRFEHHIRETLFPLLTQTGNQGLQISCPLVNQNLLQERFQFAEFEGLCQRPNDILDIRGRDIRGAAEVMLAVAVGHNNWRKYIWLGSQSSDSMPSLSGKPIVLGRPPPVWMKGAQGRIA